jgi:hypothetical protein
MGVPDGQRVWDEQVAHYADWLAPGKDSETARLIADALFRQAGR